MKKTILYIAIIAILFIPSVVLGQEFESLDSLSSECSVYQDFSGSQDLGTGDFVGTITSNNCSYDLNWSPQLSDHSELIIGVGDYNTPIIESENPFTVEAFYINAQSYGDLGVAVYCDDPENAYVLPNPTGDIDFRWYLNVRFHCQNEFYISYGSLDEEASAGLPMHVWYVPFDTRITATSTDVTYEDHALFMAMALFLLAFIPAGFFVSVFKKS